MQTKVIRNLGCRATIVREPTTAQKSDTKPGGWVASFYKLHHAHRIYVHPPRKKVVNPFYKHCHLPKAHHICAHPPREKMVNPLNIVTSQKPIVFVHTLPTILILYTIPLAFHCIRLYLFTPSTQGGESMKKRDDTDTIQSPNMSKQIQTIQSPKQTRINNSHG